MLVEVLKQHPGDQTLMFGILPFIALGLKSKIAEIRTASLLAVSQIVCRKSLTTDYAEAFFKQVSISLKENGDDAEFRK